MPYGIPGDEVPRIIFGRQDRTKIDKMLADYVKAVQAQCALLVDRDGQFITKQGDTGQADIETVAALCAGAYMVGWQMARALGKDDYQVIYNEGAKDSVQLSQVGERTILAVMFDARATLGMVRLYAKNLTKQLESFFMQVATRGPGTLA